MAARRLLGPKPAISVREMCEELGVSESGFHAYAARKAKGPSPRELADLRDFAAVKQVYDYRGYPKGSRTIAMMMPGLLGIAMNRKKVARLMAKYGISCPVRRANPLRRIAKAIATNAVFSNKLNRQFAASRPGLHLLTDISYIKYGKGRSGLCFLSAIKDASTNEIVAWRLSESLDVSFVLETVESLSEVPWLPDQVVLHSDQGCHYTSRAYRSALAAKEISQSMSRKGNCWDNAPMESWFGHAKDEIPLSGCGGFEEVRAAISDYIDYYNNVRPQIGLGRMTPREKRDCLLSRPPCLPAVVAAAPTEKWLGSAA